MVNQQGFEDSIIFDVEKAKNEIKGILELKVIINISYLEGFIKEPNSKVIDLKLTGHPCQLVPLNV